MADSDIKMQKKLIVPLYVRNLLEKIAIDEGFANIENSCIDLKAGSNQDDGFFGSLVAVTIGNNNNSDKSEKQVLHLLCKMIPGNQAARDEMNMVEMFKREAFFYQKVFPAFDEFQKAKGLDASNGFFAYPKCYACVVDEKTDQFVIIMEDLRHRQYEMWPKKEPVNLKHVRCVLREMAKFHAVSLALKAENPELFAELKVVYDLFRGLMKRQTFLDCFNNSQQRALKVIDRHLPQHANKFRSIWQNAAELFELWLDGSNFEPYAVLVHGDCWNNNMLFQYKHQQQRQQKSSVSKYMYEYEYDYNDNIRRCWNFIHIYMAHILLL